MYSLVNNESGMKKLKEGYREVSHRRVFPTATILNQTNVLDLTPKNHPKYIRRPMNARHEQVIRPPMSSSEICTCRVPCGRS